MPKTETQITYADLDRGNDFLPTAKTHRFNKENIDIQATDNSIEIKIVTVWKYDDKTKPTATKSL